MDHVLKTGAHVVYFDPTSGRHDALVTIFHGGSPEMTESEYKQKYHCEGPPCVNLLWVDPDESRTDPYGRQISRASSCSHGDSQSPKRLGNYWLWPDEV